MNTRTLLLAGLVSAAFLAPVAQAQQMPSQEELQSKKAEKLAEEWLKKADWNLDYDQAKAKAAETGKPIFAYFSRSYAY